MLIGIILGIVILIGIIYFSLKIYNDIQDAESLREQTVGALEGALSMRYDVMQKLIDYSNGRIQDENKFIIKLLQAKLIPTLERVNVEIELVNDLKDLIYKIEEIPDLRARKEFSDYKLALTKAEKNIFDAKSYLNEKTRDYNRLLNSFPRNIIAKLGGFKEKGYYDVDFVTR